MRNGEAGASQKRLCTRLDSETQTRPRARAQKAQRAAAGGGERRPRATSTRGTPAGGSAVKARRREGKKSCGKHAVDGSARVRKKFACDDGRWGVEEQCSERTRHCSHM